METPFLFGDGKTDNSAAFEAILAKGGDIVLGKGTYLTGPLTIRSNTHLVLEKGAIIRFLPEPERYVPVYSRWEGVRCYCMHPLLYIDHAENVTVEGEGTLDGGGEPWWKAALAKKHKQMEPVTDIEKRFAALNPEYRSQPEGGGGRLSQFLRPPLVQIHESSQVTLQGLTIMNSPFWTIHPLFSKNVTLRNLTVQNPYDSPNTDGIDIESCTDVLVEGCKVFVGDDGIALKSGSGPEGIRDARPASNVTIRHCHVAKAHGGAVIGSETAAGIDHITVEDCLFEGTDRGIRIKSRRGRGGEIHDLVFRNLDMRDCLCPLAINMYYRCGCDDVEASKHLFSLEKEPVTAETPRVYNVEISGCQGTKARASAAMIVGLPESPIDGLSIRDCHFSVDPEAKASPDDSDMYRGLPTPDGKGFRIRYAKNIRLENVTIEGVEKQILLEDGAVMA